MKTGFCRLLLLAAVTVLSVALVIPASAGTSTPVWPVYPTADPSSVVPVPWWDQISLKPQYDYGTYSTDVIVSSVEVIGTGTTNVYWVNLRTVPVVNGHRVRKIRKPGTKVTLTALATNIYGQEWFAVRMSDGTVGYIRSDLLNADYEIVASETPETDESYTGGGVTVTPQVIYVTPAPAESNQPTPTPILVYITPEPDATPTPEVTPQVIYIYQEDEHG